MLKKKSTKHKFDVAVPIAIGMVDAHDSKSCTFGCAGSTPA
jgi:hypothetical protein